MKKILLVSHYGIDRNGVALVILNWIRAMKNEDYEFVWYFGGNSIDEEYEDELHKKDVKLYRGSLQSEPKQSRYKKCGEDIRQIITQERPDIIHVNTGNLKMQYYVMAAASEQRVPVRIAHSHSYSHYESNIDKKQIIADRRNSLLQNATAYVACSTEAGKWLFGSNVEFQLIKNPIELERFKFNEKTRKEYRSKLNLDSDTILLGSVGNLKIEKNHEFLLEVLAMLNSRRKKFKLIILGEGELRKNLERKRTQLGLENDMYLPGSSSSVECWLSAMDIFLMPSLYEGLSLAAIEAQATGLPCLFSDQMSIETKVTEKVLFLPLNSIKIWNDSICKLENYYIKNNIDRSGDNDLCAKAGFGIETIKKCISQLYEQ